MAEPISIQQLKDASEDAISLAEFINKPENVMIPRRLASDIHSLQYYLEYMKSFAQRSYETYDEMVANTGNLSENVSVFVTNDLDTSKNGIYTYNGTSFVKGEYQPENAAKDYVEAKLGGLQVFDGKVRAQDVSTEGGGTQDVKNTEFRNELDALPFDSSNKLLSDSVKTILDASGAVVLSQTELNKATITPIRFGAKGDGVADDSASLQAAIYYSILNKNVLDGLNKTYKCSNVIFDSNLHFINAKLINNGNADLISVLTTVISRDWLENVTFDNIHIDGKRINQTAIKGTTASEDGGRHGIRIRRPARHIRIKNSSANYCAGDGICIYPDVYSGGNVLTSVIDFEIENCTFNWNRRHGGSSDRTDGMKWINTKCNFNGLTLVGSEGVATNSGAHGDTFGGKLYGSGWDIEEYEDSTYAINLLFQNCEMIDNAKGGLLVLGTANANKPPKPANIKVIGGSYNKGVAPTAEDWGISITPNSLNNTNDVYENTLISGVNCTDFILLRNNLNYVVVNTPATLSAVEKSTGYFDQTIKALYEAANSKNSTQLVLPVGKMTYNKTFNLMQVSGLPDYEINVNSYGEVEQKTYTHQGASKGKSVVSVSDTNTIYRWQTSVAPVDTLRINDSGVSMRLTGASKPANTLEMTFEAVTNTEIKVYMKGTDGITRSGVIALT